MSRSSRGGEVVELDEHDYFYYVRMDTTESEAIQAVRDYLHARALEAGDLEEGDPFEPPRLAWGGLTRARWVPDHDEEGNRRSRLVVSQNDSGRGSFSVVRIVDADESARQVQRAAEKFAEYLTFGGIIQNRFPEAVMPVSAFRDVERVVFDLPELEGPVTASQSAWPVVTVQLRDVETFKRLYAGKEEP